MFGVSVEYIRTGEEKEGGEKYYLNEETAEMAQKLFENKDLRVLFDASQKMLLSGRFRKQHMTCLWH